MESVGNLSHTNIIQLTAVFLYSPSYSYSVLLAGGACHFFMPNQFGRCQPMVTPTGLLDVIVTGCFVYDPNSPCTMDWRQIWDDGSTSQRGARGNRNGALS